jgi:hypothetical protein
MAAMQLLDERCDRHHFTERNGVNPNNWLVWFVWFVWFIWFKRPQSLKQSWAATWLGQQDRHDERRHSQQHHIVKETPHNELSAVIHQRSAHSSSRAEC